MTRISPTQKVTVVSALVSFLSTVERYRVGRTLKTDSASQKVMLDSYGQLIASLPTLSLLPGGARIQAAATSALTALDIPRMIRSGFLVEGVLTRWYYQYIYPITQEIPIVAGRRLIDPGKK